MKKIRAKGKGLPLNAPDEDDSDENDDDEAGSDEESPDNSHSSHGDDDDNAMLGESEEYDVPEEDSDGESRNTIERLKSDLFADEADDQLTGGPLFWYSSSHLTYLQTFQHMRRE